MSFRKIILHISEFGFLLNTGLLQRDLDGHTDMTIVCFVLNNLVFCSSLLCKQKATSCNTFIYLT